MLQRVSLSIAILLFAVALPGQTQQPQNADKQFVNGRWFDGSKFVTGAFYSTGGLLSKKKPAAPATTIDLQGGFVIPACADAHIHFPDSEKTLAWANPLLLNSGVFYLINPNDIGELSNPIREKLGKTDTVDVVFAHGGFTNSGGHPKRLYETLVDNKIYSYPKTELEGKAYYAIDSMADIEKKWPEFLATRPQFVKLYLLYSESYRSEDGGKSSLGLRPEFAQELVRRARAAGLRSGAHVETAEDFQNALIAGVDFVMHLPGYFWRKDLGEKDYTISEEDAALAARKHIMVVTTIDLADFPGSDAAAKEKIKTLQTRNLQRLKKAGVRLLVGTDTRPGGILGEIQSLKNTGVFTSLELLKMWCELTSQAIFPDRKIGALREGYEANFLVLGKDPLEDLDALKEIKIKVKGGEVLK